LLLGHITDKICGGKKAFTIEMLWNYISAKSFPSQQCKALKLRDRMLSL